MYAGHLIFLFLAIGVVAFLYSSVGHAGASGYIAAMTLFGLSTATIRPTALVLNILVALIASFQFWRGGHFSWKLFWPFALLSIPAAYFGGYLQLPARILKIIIGLVLLFSAARLFFRRGDPPAVAPPSLPAALAVGSGIGFLSALTIDLGLSLRVSSLFVIGRLCPTPILIDRRFTETPSNFQPRHPCRSGTRVACLVLQPTRLPLQIRAHDTIENLSSQLALIQTDCAAFGIGGAQATCL